MELPEHANVLSSQQLQVIQVLESHHLFTIFKKDISQKILNLQLVQTLQTEKFNQMKIVYVYFRYGTQLAKRDFKVYLQPSTEEQTAPVQYTTSQTHKALKISKHGAITLYKEQILQMLTEYLFLYQGINQIWSMMAQDKCHMMKDHNIVRIMEILYFMRHLLKVLLMQKQDSINQHRKLLSNKMKKIQQHQEQMDLLQKHYT